MIDSGVLTNKPVEYRQQVWALREGTDYVEFGGRYVDITPLLDSLRPVSEFRQAKNIDVSRVKSMRKVSGGGSWQDLVDQTGKGRGIKGSSEYYSPERLVELLEQVRNGEKSFLVLTRTEGFRDEAFRVLSEGVEKKAGEEIGDYMERVTSVLKEKTTRGVLIEEGKKVGLEENDLVGGVNEIYKQIADRTVAIEDLDRRAEAAGIEPCL